MHLLLDYLDAIRIVAVCCCMLLLFVKLLYLLLLNRIEIRLMFDSMYVYVDNFDSKMIMGMQLGSYWQVVVLLLTHIFNISIDQVLYCKI